MRAAPGKQALRFNLLLNKQAVSEYKDPQLRVNTMVFLYSDNSKVYGLLKREGRSTESASDEQWTVGRCTNGREPAAMRRTTQFLRRCSLRTIQETSAAPVGLTLATMTHWSKDRVGVKASYPMKVFMYSIFPIFLRSMCKGCTYHEMYLRGLPICGLFMSTHTFYLARIMYSLNGMIGIHPLLIYQHG